MFRGTEKITVYSRNTDVNYESHSIITDRIDNLIDNNCSFLIKGYNSKTESYDYVKINKISKNFIEKTDLVFLNINNITIWCTKNCYFYISVNDENKYKIISYFELLKLFNKNKKIKVMSQFGDLIVTNIGIKEYSGYMYSIETETPYYIFINDILIPNIWGEKND